MGSLSAAARFIADASLICASCSVISACIALPAPARAAEHDFRGQASAWITGSSDDGERFHNGGIRYIPQYSLRYAITADNMLDFEASLNAWAAFGSAEGADDADIEPYRISVGIATPRTDFRIGLQKISFGPAFLLRALMWFDSLDPRDPLQLTDGVYGARFRYVTMDNTSFLLWALYGNDDLKGIEILPSDEERLEFGGRLQLPVPAGELAFSCHNREVDGAQFYMADFTESRFALDAKWDVEIGLWFEVVFQQQSIGSQFIAALPVEGGEALRATADAPSAAGASGAVAAPSVLDGIELPPEWAKIMMLGADYTFGIGSGVHLLCEHMVTAFSDEPFGWEEDRQISAYSINYPIGYLDNVSAIGLYSWETETYYQYLAWQRTWDDLILKLGLFHYPDAELPGGFSTRSSAGTGYGGQITIIYNH